MDAVGRVAILTEDGDHPTWSPDGTRIAFDWAAGALGSSDIWVMNADGTGRTNLTQTETVIEKDPSWSPDGKRLVFTGGDLPNLDIMNADGTGRRALVKGQSAAGVWSPDGSRVAFIAPAGSGFGLFTVHDDGTGQVRLTPEGATADGPPSWSPAGDRLAFQGYADGDEDVFVIGADGTGLTNLTNTSDVNEYLGPQGWSP
jgi:TolB protein